MKAAPLPSAQKGFVTEEGVAANINLLQTMVQNTKKNNDNLSEAFIDFKKAFDSVGLPSLVAATRRWDFPSEMTE